MTSLLTEDPEFAIHNPLDLLEELLSFNEWAYERNGDDELHASIKGGWCDYQLKCYWRDEDSVLQIACIFDMRVKDKKRAAVHETLALINERLWMGHFEIWEDDGDVMYRHAAFVDKGPGLSLSHAETLIQAAVGECERFYPVFQFVLWAGKKPTEALEAALLETVGEA